MAANAFITFFDKADGESIQKGKEKWVEIRGWDWEVDAGTSWAAGGGASVGKPNPGKLRFEHLFDTSSTVILASICTGKALPKLELQMLRTGGKGNAETYFAMTMESAFITKVSNAANAEGILLQQVELVFKTVKIEYRPQDLKTGAPGAIKSFNWNIPGNIASATG